MGKLYGWYSIPSAIITYDYNGLDSFVWAGPYKGPYKHPTQPILVVPTAFHVGAIKTMIGSLVTFGQADYR